MAFTCFVCHTARVLNRGRNRGFSEQGYAACYLRPEKGRNLTMFIGPVRNTASRGKLRGSRDREKRGWEGGGPCLIH